MKSLNRAASILLGCFVLTGCSSLHKEVQSGVLLDQGSYETRSVHYHQVLDELGPPSRLTASPGGFAFIYEDLVVNELQLGISGHNNFWYWAPEDFRGDIMIVLGRTRQNLEQVFDQVQLAATTHCDYCMPYENNLPVWICREPKFNFDEVWPQSKSFD